MQSAIEAVLARGVDAVLEYPGTVLRHSTWWMREFGRRSGRPLRRSGFRQDPQSQIRPMMEPVAQLKPTSCVELAWLGCSHDFRAQVRSNA